MTQTDDARGRIFLQSDGGISDKSKTVGAVTWCLYRCNNTDTEWVRADLEATASLSIATQPDPMADPRVTALVGALKMAVLWLEYEGKYDVMGMKAAIAAFNTTDKPQGANNEVKGGKDE